MFTPPPPKQKEKTSNIFNSVQVHSVYTFSHDIQKSYHSDFAVVRKNWDPFVLGPEFAIDSNPVEKFK